MPRTGTGLALLLTAALLALGAAPSGAETQVLTFAPDSVGEFVALSQIPQPDDQVAARFLGLGKSGPPAGTAAGDYIVYSLIDGTHVQALFFGPYPAGQPGARIESEFEDLRGVVEAARSRDANLIPAVVQIIPASALRALGSGGFDSWLVVRRNERIEFERASRELVGSLEGRSGSDTLSRTEATQLHAALESLRTGRPPSSLAGLTLSAEEAEQLYLRMATAFLKRGQPYFQLGEAVTEGMAGAEIRGALGAAIAKTPWLEEDQRSIARTAERVSLAERLSPATSRQTLVDLGKGLIATAAENWNVSTPGLIAPTPSASDLDRVARVLATADEDELAEVIAGSLPSSIQRGSLDVAEGLITEFFTIGGRTHEEPGAAEVGSGVELFHRAIEELSPPPLDRESFDRLLREGGGNEDVEKLAALARSLRGVSAHDVNRIVGRASDELVPKNWTPQEIRRIVAGVDQAARTKQVSKEIEEAAGDRQLDIHQALEKGLDPAVVDRFIQALGEAEAARHGETSPSEERARQAGEEALDRAGFDPDEARQNGLTGEEVGEASGAESGEPETGDDGSVTEGGEDGGTGSDGGDSGTGSIPLKSLPVLEMIGRLVAKYFGVDAFAEQLLTLCYALVPELFEQIAAELAKLEKQFGGDLQNLAKDVNQILAQYGQQLSIVGGLIDTAVSKGMEAAGQQLLDLATEEFREDAVQGLKSKIGEALGIPADAVDLEFLMGLPDGIDLPKLQGSVEELLADQGRQALEQALGEQLQPGVWSSLAGGDLEAAGRELVEHKKKEILGQVAGQIGLPTEVLEAAAKGKIGSGDELLTAARDQVTGILADETGLSVDTARSLLEDPGAAKASLDAELEKAGRQALLGMVGDEETLRVVLEEPGVGVEEIVRKQVEAELDRRFENRPEVRGLAESVLDGDADAARQQLQEALARQVSSVSEVVTPLLDLAADPGPERLAALAAQLEDRGLLPPEAASAIADARTLRDRLADEAWKWAIDAAEIRLFAYRDCIAAITAGESSAVANACRPWLEDLELVDVERFKVCSPPDAELARLAEAVKGGDVAAIGAVLLRCRLTSQVPEIRDLDLQALASDPAALRGQLTEQARRRLTEELDEVAPGLGGALESLDTDGGSAALGIVAEGVGGSLRHFAAAMQSGDYSTAADALLRARALPQSLQRLLSEEERAILEDLPQLGVAETVRQLADAFAARAMEAGSKLARETSPELVGVLEIAECLKTSPPETCESLKQVWIGDRVDTALAEVPDSMRKSIAAGDAVGLGEAVVDYGLRKPLEELGLGAIAEECRSADEAAFEGCLVLRGALVPALERRGINLQPETLDEILEDGVLDLGDLKALVAAAGDDGLQVVEQFTGMPRKELLELVQTPDPLRSPERVAELKEKFVASAAEQLGIETQRLSDLLGSERPTAP